MDPSRAEPECAPVRCLLVAVGARSAAVPMTSVVEIMRPLPSTALPGAARGVVGVALVRGVATIVVELAVLLGERAGDADRWVSVRSDQQLALAARVVGVIELDRAEIEAGRALARAAAPFVTSVVKRDDAAVPLLDLTQALSAIARDELDAPRAIDAEDAHQEDGHA